MFLRPSDLVKRMGLREGMRVADFGAGSGHFTRALAPAVGRSGRVCAVDIQGDLLARLHKELAGEGHQNVDILRGDIETDELPFSPEAFDAAVIANTLFQLDEKERVLLSLRRFLKPAGVLLLSDWAGSFNHLGPHPDAVYAERAAREALARGGFVVKSAVPAGFYHWALVAEKSVTDI
jgi:ubiquinone/menaquinone biosynthesis C-methylase UbiE